MKKLIAFALALVMVLLLAACGGGANDKTPTSNNDNPGIQQQEQQPSSTPDEGGEEEVPEVPNEFTVAAGDDQVYEELTFENDITINLDPASTVDHRSQILFWGCTFNGNIKVIGDRSAFLRFTDGCVFGENCEITVVEATDGATDGMTLDDDFIKLLFTDVGAVIHAESVCNVLCMNGEGIVVDGVEYLKADFPDNVGFCVATYFENGEKQVFTLGVDE